MKSEVVVRSGAGLSPGNCPGRSDSHPDGRNHIIIRHAEGEYGFYAHLIPDSITVEIGDKVGQGDIIGRCGFSGNSSEPPLHFHLQDGPDFYSAMGLPVRFADIIVNGAYTDEVVVERGMRVSCAESSAMRAGQ